jgi:hypothetical protein
MWLNKIIELASLSGLLNSPEIKDAHKLIFSIINFNQAI